MATRRLVLLAFLSALLIISKEILRFIPNVELVTFLLMIYAKNLRLSDSLIICLVFVLMQVPLYGVGDWFIVYLFVWPLLVLVVYYLRNKLNNVYRMTIVSGLYGLLFGLFFSIPYIFISFRYAYLFFIKGIPFDLIHGISNALIMLVLYDMVNPQFKKLVHHFETFNTYKG